MKAYRNIRVDLYQATYLWRHLTSVLSSVSSDAAKREFVDLIADLQDAVDILADEEEVNKELMR